MKTVFRVSQQVSYKAAYTASRARYRLEILDRETKEITVIILSFVDRSVGANSADPDQTAPRGAV